MFRNSWIVFALHYVFRLILISPRPSQLLNLVGQILARAKIIEVNGSLDCTLHEIDSCISAVRSDRRYTRSRIFYHSSPGLSEMLISRHVVQLSLRDRRFTTLLLHRRILRFRSFGARYPEYIVAPIDNHLSPCHKMVTCTSATFSPPSGVRTYLIRTWPKDPAFFPSTISSALDNWMFMYESTLISRPLYSV